MALAITQIDSLAIANATHYNLPLSIVQVDDTHFMVAWTGTSYYLHLTIFSHDSDFDNIAQVSTSEFYSSAASAADMSLAKLSDTVYAVAFRNNSNVGVIQGIRVNSSSYAISKGGSVEYQQGLEIQLLGIDSTHLIITYRGDGGNGYMATYSIDDVANNITEIDTENIGYFSDGASLIKIDSTHFAFAYYLSGGYVETYSIDGSYDNITLIDSLKHDTTYGTWNSLSLIDSTHLALAYKGKETGGYGYIKTFSFDGSYDTITQTDVLEHDTDVSEYDTTNCRYNSLVTIDATHLILAYRSSDLDGWIKTFSLDGSYDITQESTLEHTLYDSRNVLIKIGNDYYALAYVDESSVSYVKTFSTPYTSFVPQVMSF